MMRRLVLIAVAMMCGAVAFSQDGFGVFESAVLGLTGYTNVEDLNEEELERYADLYSRPLPLNYSSTDRLLSSGLFTAYQVAVLEDYRSLSGDILSFEELSSLEGFNYEFVSALRYFISLDSGAAPGQASVRTPSVRNAFTLKSGIRNTKDVPQPEGTYSMKYRLGIGESIDIGLSLRSAYRETHFPPEKISFFAAAYGRRRPWKLILGDYSLRYGQGLCLWSGFSLSGVSSPDSFIRKPSGISPYNSYSGDGSFRGLAAGYEWKSFSISAFMSMPGLRELMEGEEEYSKEIFYGANLAWHGRRARASVTGLSSAHISSDLVYALAGTDLFAELSYDLRHNALAGLAGLRTQFADDLAFSAMLRYYSSAYSSDYSGAIRSGTACSNEYAVSAALSHSAGSWVDIAGKTGFGSSEKRHSASLSADLSYSPEPKYGVDTSSWQFKCLFTEKIRISENLAAILKISERYRTYGMKFRTDVKIDFRSSFSRFSCNLRLNMLHSQSFAWLSYIEGGYIPERLSIWLRAGIFRVDHWNDRIYAYERDGPGNFNSPAYYGRGYWVAATSSVKLSRSLRLYFRASFQDWPWLRPQEIVKKPPKVELKLQLVADIMTFRKKKIL